MNTVYWRAREDEGPFKGKVVVLTRLRQCKDSMLFTEKACAWFILGAHGLLMRSIFALSTIKSFEVIGLKNKTSCFSNGYILVSIY